MIIGNFIKENIAYIAPSIGMGSDLYSISIFSRNMLKISNVVRIDFVAYKSFSLSWWHLMVFIGFIPFLSEWVGSNKE